MWLEQVDLVQANQTYKTLMAKLNNYSGVDMAKEFNDVYGQTDLDYAREFDEYSAEEKFNNIKLQEQIEDVNELIAGKK